MITRSAYFQIKLNTKTKIVYHMLKKLTTSLFILVLTWTSMMGQTPQAIHDSMRTTPYPQKGNAIYINPVPLIVPKDMKESDYLQFNLSRNKDFSGDETITSKPILWNLYNVHRELEEGTWYWRFRSVSNDGKEYPWSGTYSFTITNDIPKFVTPTAEVYLKNIPSEFPRMYAFLNNTIDEARKNVRKDPEFEQLIADSRSALAFNLKSDSDPYSKVTQLFGHQHSLLTAYLMFQLDIYKEHLIQNIRYLLANPNEDKAINNDFQAGELAYSLASAYEYFYNDFTPKERKQIEHIVHKVLVKYYANSIVYNENHIFNNHFWQFTFRHLLQSALVMKDVDPLALEYLEYSYELWTARAPATGFNRSGVCHNGTSYFSANAITLTYIPTLFSYITGTDFFQHPFYQNVGLGLAYSWLPNSLSTGFGDGHEKMNPKPLRIRSAFADYMARTTGDPYATWYSSLNTRYLIEPETRLYRMASGKSRPDSNQLPKDAPKAAFFKDVGEMLVNTDLNDLDKNISLSFHSSPYGSGSHTHSNQNAFNLHYGGRAVYRSVGHYMNFKDLHNLLSYRHTRAHNTMLVDNMGQGFTTRAYGYITRMFNGDHISYALGDASNAYKGVSEYPMWEKNFQTEGIEQSREHGFGATPLKKYLRHIFFLDPNIVVIYDELEASKPVTWDWLLHSPTEFQINRTENILKTIDREGEFTSIAQIFSNQKFELTQKEGYIAEPNKKVAVRGEDLRDPWSLAASFKASKANRILTIIQLDANGNKAVDIQQDKTQFKVGDWTINAELNVKHPASIYITNSVLNVTFSTGLKQAKVNGETVRLKNRDASLLYDTFNGKRELKEAIDSPLMPTGKLK